MKRSIIYILIVIAGYVILLFTAFLLWHQRLNSIQFPHGFCNEWDIVHDYRCGGITLDSAKCLFFKGFPEPPKCPICGWEVLPVYYGFGDQHEFEYDLEGRKRRIWGGCVVEGRWKCLQCGQTY